MMRKSGLRLAVLFGCLMFLGCAGAPKQMVGPVVIDGWKTNAGGSEISKDCWRSPAGAMGMPPHMACVSGFSGALSLITDKSFLDRWERAGSEIQIPDIRTVHQDEEFYPALIFSGAGPDEFGKAYVTADVMVKDSEGQPVHAVADLECWVDRPVPIRHRLELCEEYPRLVFTQHTPPGDYEIVVFLRDQLKRTALLLYTDVEVLAKQ